MLDSPVILNLGGIRMTYPICSTDNQSYFEKNGTYM